MSTQDTILLHPRQTGRRSRLLRRLVLGAFVLQAILRNPGAIALASAFQPDDPQHQVETTTPAEHPIYIREYRVLGVEKLPKIDVEAAVYPFLGPGRTSADVEQARAAVEKAYQDKGYQAASVEVPPQQARHGIVVLQAYEGKVGKLRIKGARYFLPSAIKARARSLAEGRAINFNDVNRDIVALNQLPDRRVTPVLRAGEEPGTVDVDLNVKDTFPLHGSVELNNRRSLDTTPLRLNAALSYNNLWQAGHSIGASFQTSPQAPDEVQVYSGYYVARFASLDWLSVMVQGSKQDSNVSTLGAVAVAGKGETLGTRIILALPSENDLFHSLSFGIDYKHYNNAVTLAGIASATPITYYPITVGYNATINGKGSVTEFNGGVTYGLRGFGSRSSKFDQNRYKADANFLYLRADLSRTQKLPGGFELFGKVQGQIADQPLVSNEQFGGGGLGTVRGYLEAEVVGDNAAFGTLELRGPQMPGWLPWKGNTLQLYIFGEGGLVTMRDPLPEQQESFKLASIGLGGRLQLLDYLNGSIDLALPLVSQAETQAYHPFLAFRIWADF
jgi:hemolysin activation/secretion protein